ncbi:MAG: hypothetical protein JO047_14870 [Alphaproteobacteria bacterium]|nr:hypothetical protein [Alphaproteobacteria bacterium]
MRGIDIPGPERDLAECVVAGEQRSPGDAQAENRGSGNAQPENEVNGDHRIVLA